MSFNKKEIAAIALILIGFPGGIIPGLIIGQELGFVIMISGIFLPCLIIQVWAMFDIDMKDWQTWGHDDPMEKYLKELDAKVAAISPSSIKNEVKE